MRRFSEWIRSDDYLNSIENSDLGPTKNFGEQPTERDTITVAFGRSYLLDRVITNWQPDFRDELAALADRNDETIEIVVLKRRTRL